MRTRSAIAAVMALCAMAALPRAQDAQGLAACSKIRRFQVSTTGTIK